MSTLEPRGDRALGRDRRFEGGYTLSEEFAKGMLADTAQRAEQAKRS
jgi:hypothetical protein